MKKLLLIIACCLQFVNAQTKPAFGEYLSRDKSNSGINLLLKEDKTFQMFVLNGTYEIKNDSIIFTNNPDALSNSFKVQFVKSKTINKKITIFIEPTFQYIKPTFFLGIQNKPDGEIVYKAINEYLNQKEIDDYFERSYREKKEDVTNKMSFEIDKPNAMYLVQNTEVKTNIEKYLISSDVSEIKIENNFNIFDQLEMSGIIEDTNTLKVLINKLSPLKFINKNAKTETISEIPVIKTIEKNWSYPGKKEYNEMYSDTAATVVDSSYAYSNSEKRYEFKAKVEKNLKEALLNIKKDTTKYLLVIYNLKDKENEKDFNDFIADYNTNIGYNMYSEYESIYDKYNFYLATKNDEAFFKKKNIKEKSILILNNDGEIIASSSKKIEEISNTLYYDTSYLNNKLKETENAILISKAITNKKTSIPDLTKSLNTNYKDFFTSNYYSNNIVTYAAEELEIEVKNAESDIVYEAVDSTSAIENNDFTYYKSEISEKVLTEKLNLIFDYYSSKNKVDNQLINILLGEISGNHTNFDLFKNENSNHNKQEIKYINYILKYNEDEKTKVKIATLISSIINEKQANNPDIESYKKIGSNLIAYSGNNLNIIQTAVSTLNQKENSSEEANKLVDLYYSTLVNDKPVFENIDSQFNNLNTGIDYNLDWMSYKSQINAFLNSQAWDIFETNKTTDFQRAIKWSELSNIVDKDNPYSLDTLGQLYFAVGRKSEAIVIQTKAVAIAKAKNINFEEFEKALITMKK